MSRPGPLALRLAAVMAAVALAGVVAFAGVVYLVDRADVRHEASTRQKDVVQTLTSAATAAYTSAGSWTQADLRPVTATAAGERVGYTVTSAIGATVITVPPPGTKVASSDEVPLTDDGASIGTLTVTEPEVSLPPEISALRNALTHSVFAAAAVAAGFAVLVALVVAGRVTRPVKALTVAMRRHAAGYRVDPGSVPAGPGELGELAGAFHAMTADLDEEARLRRGMVADLAHELRTPIAVLQAETEALLDGVAEPTPEATASLHEEVLRLGRLVEDLQTLASAEAAHLDLQTRALDLAEVTASALDGQAHGAREAGVTLLRNLTPAPVVGDPLRLHQIVTNLLTNAIKWSPAGGRVQVEVAPGSVGAQLEVTDAGPGIPEELLPHVFERFRRGDHVEVPGSGVGLTVVRELVEAHGGTVELLAAEGGGTRAVVHLPAG